MADSEHMEIVGNGAEAIRQWRKKNRDVSLNLIGAFLPACDLRGADLSWADLTGASLEGADLRRANLIGARLMGVKLSDLLRSTAVGLKANLSGANLKKANLYGTDLSEINLSRVNLSEANLYETNFKGANLSGADLTRAYCGKTIFADMDLSKAKGLESIEHGGPSIIGVETFYKSKGKIPEAFLRGCGVPDELISYGRSLTEGVVGFYSCFISYSTKDQEFANRLYADLQNKGVRCWFAPEDLKIGDKFRQRIDESIHLHDKLLLILSEQSITSPWVEAEVEAALDREQRENRLILFPISIDSAVWISEKAWAASLRRMRHVGDFSNWTQRKVYQKSFTKLLRDLKAEG